MSDIQFLVELGDSLEQAIQHQPQRRHFTRLRGLHGRRLALFATVGMLAFGGAATAGVLGVESLLSSSPAVTLFRDDPRIWNQDNHNHPGPDGVIPSTVTKVQTLSIPRVGELQYWVARTRSGGSCEAFKLPDGRWGGTGPDTNYNFGGSVPGCHAPNQGGDIADGGGFDFETDTVGPPTATDKHAARDFTYILFGTVDVRGAVRVRDLETGHTAPIVDGHFFAITRTIAEQRSAIVHGERLPHLRHRWPSTLFQALDRTGKVLTTSWTESRILKTFAAHHPRS
jgi:hypothetical protein